jgi:hypothetical protein
MHSFNSFWISRASAGVTSPAIRSHIKADSTAFAISMFNCFPLNFRTRAVVFIASFPLRRRESSDFQKLFSIFSLPWLIVLFAPENKVLSAEQL